MAPIKYHTADVDGFKVFYREAGPAGASKLLLLHGFPSAGHMFRDLIPLLADRFHIVAPDLPGFGQSDMPPREKFNYTFDNIARVIDRFTEVIGFDRFAVYVFDYGAPTGFRLAARHPERIKAIISQNGNAYEEDSARAGVRLRPTGKTRRRRTERRSAPSSLRRQHAGSTRTAYPTRRRCRRMARISTTSIWLVPVQMKCSSTSSATTRATSRCIPNSRPIFASTSRRFWHRGARTIRFSFRRAPRRSSVTFETLRCASSARATSPSRHTLTRSLR
jgi:pimeloyl-ACP methyl ester carboxylesterase